MWESIKGWLFRSSQTKERDKRDILCDDVLILILKNLDFEDLMKMKRISSQFKDCIEEVFRRRKYFLIADKNNKLFLMRVFFREFYFQRFKGIDYKKEIFSDFNILVDIRDFSSTKTLNHFKSVFKECKEVKVLAINHIIDEKFMDKTYKSVEVLYLGPICLRFDISRLERMAQIFENKIYSLILYFDEYVIQNDIEVITLLKEFPKLKELKVIRRNSYENVMSYIPSTIRILSLQFTHFQSNEYIQSLKQMIEKNENQFIGFDTSYPINDNILESMKPKSNLKTLSIVWSEIQIKKFFDFLLVQKYIRDLTFERLPEERVLRMGLDIHMKYIFPNLRSLWIENINIKISEFKSFMKCFPNVLYLDLHSIDLLCKCNQWSNICIQCSSQCSDVLAKLQSLRLLALSEIKTIRIDSLKKFEKLNAIILYDRSIDYKVLVSKAKLYSIERPSKMLRLYFDDITVEELNELKENIPKNLFLDKDFDI